MKIQISNNMKVSEINEQFISIFPHLKLEFYSHKHENNEGSSVSDQVKQNVYVKELNPNIEKIEFEIKDEMTVSDFEKLFNTHGLSIQVFRKSNHLWLQTSTTDHWTLEKQNGKSHRSTLDHHINPTSIQDFDLE